MANDSTLPEEACDVERIATLRHQHRNQIQNMISLVGLFGRQLPSGECKRRFSDLHARFVALSHVSTIRGEAGGDVEVDLAELAERLVETLDPAGLHRIVILDAPWPIPGRSADSVCQLLCEIVIALFRQGLPIGEPATAEIAVASGSGEGVVIRATSTAAAEVSDDGALGWSIAESIAQSLGGSVHRLSEAPLAIEARLPGALSER